MVGPMRREGITSLERTERARMGKHLAELSNAGMVKQMKELGILPDNTGVDMSQYSSGIAALPSGVTSLQDIKNEADVARQIEQFNAGILDQEHREQKALMEIAKKRQQSQYRQKIIQWLAETDELDEVPTEFAEEVTAYYRSHGGDKKRKEVADKRDARKKREEKKQEDLLKIRSYWQPASKPFSALQHETGPGVRYSTNSGALNSIGKHDYTPSQSAVEAAQLENEWDEMVNSEWGSGWNNYGGEGAINFDALKKTPAEQRKKEQAEQRKKIVQWLAETDEVDEIPADFVDEVEAYRKNKEGEILNSGWRAPRLHKLIRPLKRFEIDETPDKIIEDQKQALDDRRAMYKDEQTHQRGAPPPKGMIERAMPKLAEPFSGVRPVPQHYIRPNFGVTLHPFIFPNKKYMFKTGVF